MSVIEAEQLVFFHADDYEISTSHGDRLLAMLGLRRPICRCGDPFKSHQHYRKGADCSFCQCQRYEPARSDSLVF